MHPLASQTEFIEGQPAQIGLSMWVDVVSWNGGDGWKWSKPAGKPRYGIDGREVTREEFEAEAARRGIDLPPPPVSEQA